MMNSLADGYRALVVGASGGIGSALAASIAADPRSGGVVGLSRSEDGFDITDEQSVARHFGALAGQEFDLVLCATGALVIDGSAPEKTIRAIDAEAMAAQFRLNAIGPALVLKQVASLLPRGRRSLVGVLSARVGSIGDNRLGGWISYRAAKAALNQIVRTSAIEIARNRPGSVVLALHPGTVATRLSASHAHSHPPIAPQDSAARLLAVLDRADAGQTGTFYAHDGAAIEW